MSVEQLLASSHGSIISLWAGLWGKQELELELKLAHLDDLLHKFELQANANRVRMEELEAE